VSPTLLCADTNTGLPSHDLSQQEINAGIKDWRRIVGLGRRRVHTVPKEIFKASDAVFWC
jgi:hypothetical protein